MNIAFQKSALNKKEHRYAMSRMSLLLKWGKWGKKNIYLKNSPHDCYNQQFARVHFRAQHNYNMLVCGVLFFFLVGCKITSRYSA